MIFRISCALSAEGAGVASFFGSRLAGGLLPTAVAVGLERLTTAKPKSELSFKGCEFVMTALSEADGLSLGCAGKMVAEWAFFASSWRSDLEDGS